MKSFLLAFSAFSFLIFPAAAQQATGGPVMLSENFSPEAIEKQRLAQFANLLDEAAQKEDFVGLAVAVVRRGEIELVKTYGVRDVQTRAPVTEDTVFRIGSLSKGFAASLAGMAVAGGELSLDAAVAPYAPRLALKNGAEARLTIEDILSHRTGLPPNAYDNLLEAGRPVDAILPKFKSVSPICSVGSCYAYQNIAYDLIGDVLTAGKNADYETLVTQKLFTPLGMRSASFGSAALTQNNNWARPHVRVRDGDDYGPWKTTPVTEPYYRTPAAGGVNASITDMAKWLAAQMGYAPDVLPEDVTGLIHRPRVNTPRETRRWRSLSLRIRDTHYGLGWRIYDYAGHRLINHSGSVEGYGAQIAWLPEQNVGIVILANARAERLWRILPTFLDIELGLPEEDWLR